MEFLRHKHEWMIQKKKKMFLNLCLVPENMTDDLWLQFYASKRQRQYVNVLKYKFQYLLAN